MRRGIRRGKLQSRHLNEREEENQRMIKEAKSEMYFLTVRIELIVFRLAISLTSSRVVDALLLQPGSVGARVLSRRSEKKSVSSILAKESSSVDSDGKGDS